MSTLLAGGSVKDQFCKSIAASMKTKYALGFALYANFLSMSGIQRTHSKVPPVDEETLMNFVTYCHSQLGLKSYTGSIKLYMCGIRFNYLDSDTPNLVGTCDLSSSYRLEAVMHGNKKSEHSTTRPRLPITWQVLCDICHTLRQGFFGS